MEWAILPLKKYADFTGRARRKEFWMYVLLNIGIIIVTSILDGMAGMSGNIGGVYGPITAIAALGLLIPSIAVSVRRLHDTDRSGWWLLLAFVPFIGGLVLLVFYILEGTRGTNRFGTDPLALETPSAA